jgi:hypothetical protein
MGSAWVGVYVDGINQQPPFTWPSLPVDRWMHLHLNAASPLAYDLMLMAAKDTSGGVVRRSPRIALTKLLRRCKKRQIPRTT